jgi:hypothetical protein
MWCRIPSRPSSPWTSCRRTRQLRARLFRIAHNRALDLLCRDRQAALARAARHAAGAAVGAEATGPSTPIRGWWRRWLRAGSRNHGRIAGDVAEYNRAHESYRRCSIPTTAPAVGPSSSTAPPGPADDVASMHKLLPLRPRTWTYRCDAATDANALARPSLAGGPLARLFRLHGVNKEHKSELRSPPAQL